MKSFWIHFIITTIVWAPLPLAVVGEVRNWNFWLIFMLSLGQAGLIATLVALLAEVSKHESV